MTNSFHTNQAFNTLFISNNCQGIPIKDARVIIWGEDANFAHNIFLQEPFYSKHIVPYLENGKKYLQNAVDTKFVANNGVAYSHPFQLVQYNGSGNKYHENVKKLFLTENLNYQEKFILSTAFCEVLPFPSIIKPTKEDFLLALFTDETRNHLISIFNDINDGITSKLIIIPPTAYSYLKKAINFFGLESPFPIYSDNKRRSLMYKEPSNHNNFQIGFCYHPSYRMIKDENLHSQRDIIKKYLMA